MPLISNSFDNSLFLYSTDANTEDQFLTRVRVLCWVMTSPKTLMSRALHVRNTWGSRCDRTLYMSSQENRTFPAVGLHVPEGRDALWDKTRAAFKYIYDHNLTHSYDWFLKADDDTYVIVKNLKYFLRDKNASDLVYYGHHFKPYVRNGYMSGGAGYVLSKTALEKFVELGLTNKHFNTLVCSKRLIRRCIDGTVPSKCWCNGCRLERLSQEKQISTCQSSM